MIIALKTDRPIAELYVWKDDGTEVTCHVWEADNQLSQQLPERLQQILDSSRITMDEVSGVVAYQGPGSFTGLRIGLTVANTLAYANQIPIAGGTGDNWQHQGLVNLKQSEPGGQVLPEYGGEAHITSPKR